MLLHPPLLEVEAQCQKQQLNPHILLSSCEKSAESKVVLNKAKSTLYLNRTNNADIIMLDERTIYNYIDASLLSVGNLDLPRKVRYRARKKKKPLYIFG